MGWPGKCPWASPAHNTNRPLLLDLTRALLKPEVSGTESRPEGVVRQAGGPLGVG